MKPFTAVLVVPERISKTSDFGGVFVVWVTGQNAEQARGAAQIQAAREAQADWDVESNPDDWFVSALFKGHHRTLVP